MKVGDFGLSKIRKGASVSGFRRGTVRWMAPELMIVSKPSNKVSTKVKLLCVSNYNAEGKIANYVLLHL